MTVRRRSSPCRTARHLFRVSCPENERQCYRTYTAAHHGHSRRNLHAARTILHVNPSRILARTVVNQQRRLLKPMRTVPVFSCRCERAHCWPLRHGQYGLGCHSDRRSCLNTLKRRAVSVFERASSVHALRRHGHVVSAEGNPHLMHCPLPISNW